MSAFPKALYQRDGTTRIVKDADAEALALRAGYLLAADYHAQTPAEGDADVLVPFTPIADTPAEEPKKRGRKPKAE